MPLVGSSRITTLELPMRAMATHSLRFMPPLRDAESEFVWAMHTYERCTRHKHTAWTRSVPRDRGVVLSYESCDS